MTILKTEAIAAINAGHALVQALPQHLSAIDLDKLNMLTTAGASVALTMKWIEGRVELRVGVVPGDSEPEAILALNFDNAAHAPTPRLNS